MTEKGFRIMPVDVSALQQRIRELEAEKQALFTAAKHHLKRNKALEATIARVEALPTYAVNQAIGREGEYPMYCDPTGSWVAIGDIQAALQQDKDHD